VDREHTFPIGCGPNGYHTAWILEIGRQASAAKPIRCAMQEERALDRAKNRARTMTIRIVRRWRDTYAILDRLCR
jgi:hypothetical protein